MNNRTPDRRVHILDMAGGETFDLPGVRGRMERLQFPCGIILYRVEYEALDDCFFTMTNPIKEPWVGSALHIQGQSDLIAPNGERFKQGPDTAMLMRVDQPEVRYQLFKGQLIRHIGALSTIKNLRRRFDGKLPSGLKPFNAPYGDTFQVHTLTPSTRLRQFASGLFSHHVNGSCRSLKMEGTATLFLSEVIEGLEAGANHNDVLPLWEETAYQHVLAQIRQSLDSAISISALADLVDLPEKRLDQLFRLKHDQTCPEFIRSERMALAQRLLEEGQQPVKVVAHRVGYSHVSNFSRAYRIHFGETPARTLRRTATT